MLWIQMYVGQTKEFLKVQSKMENATVTGSSTDLPMHLVKDSLYVKLN